MFWHEVLQWHSHSRWLTTAIPICHVMYLTRNIPLDSKMAAADKNVVALLNGIARRDYFGELEITNEFLHQELFADLEEEQFQSMLKKYETLMRNIVSADMDFNQLEAFLTSQMKRKQGALTQGQAAAFLKFWKSQKTKIHDVLVQKSSWNNKLKDINWRIDLKSQARHLQQINTPVAIVEMQVEKRTKENKVRCPCWFYWREVGATPRRGERWVLLSLCISQFQLHPAPPPHPRLLWGICLPCQSRGWDIWKFCTAQGPGICQPRGHSQAFDMYAVSYQNITTQKILLEKKADWLICQGQE